MAEPQKTTERKGRAAMGCVYPDDREIGQIVEFRLEANVNTYAAKSNETEPTRPGSHDFSYSRGPYTYYDTYVGGEQFAGEEAVWHDGKTVYAMNYCGRVLDRRFSGDFLKEALKKADRSMPYRGPGRYESDGYAYTCRVDGDIRWFQGYEEISFEGLKVYECFFHGGLLKQ